LSFTGLGNEKKKGKEEAGRKEKKQRGSREKQAGEDRTLESPREEPHQGERREKAAIGRKEVLGETAPGLVLRKFERGRSRPKKEKTRMSSCPPRERETTRLPLGRKGKRVRSTKGGKGKHFPSIKKKKFPRGASTALKMNDREEKRRSSIGKEGEGTRGKRKIYQVSASIKKKEKKYRISTKGKRGEKRNAAGKKKKNSTIPEKYKNDAKVKSREEKEPVRGKKKGSRTGRGGKKGKGPQRERKKKKESETIVDYWSWFQKCETEEPAAKEGRAGGEAFHGKIASAMTQKEKKL